MYRFRDCRWAVFVSPLAFAFGPPLLALVSLSDVEEFGSGSPLPVYSRIRDTVGIPHKTWYVVLNVISLFVLFSWWFVSLERL